MTHLQCVNPQSTCQPSSPRGTGESVSFCHQPVTMAVLCDIRSNFCEIRKLFGHQCSLDLWQRDCYIQAQESHAMKRILWAVMAFFSITGAAIAERSWESVGPEQLNIIKLVRI